MVKEIKFKTNDPDERIELTRAQVEGIMRATMSYLGHSIVGGLDEEHVERILRNIE